MVFAAEDSIHVPFSDFSPLNRGLPYLVQPSQADTFILQLVDHREDEQVVFKITNHLKCRSGVSLTYARMSSTVGPKSCLFLGFPDPS